MASAKRQSNWFGLRERLTLILGLAIFAILILTWWLSRWLVFEPFSRDVLKSQMAQAQYLAEEIEKGVSIETLERRHRVQLKLSPRLPHRLRRWNQARFKPKCHRKSIDQRKLVICRNPRGPVAVTLKSLPSRYSQTHADRHRHSIPPKRSPRRHQVKWLLISRHLTPESLLNGLLWVFGVVSVIILSLSALLATLITQPIRASIEAMNRMADGDLSHRFPESGALELRGMSRAFNRMADRITTLLATERRLMAGISHELRTPLTRLRLHLELLRSDESTVLPARLDAMEGDMENIDHLIGEIIESSRLSMGEVPLTYTNFQLQDLVKDVLQQQPLPQHRVEIVGTSLIINGDYQKLARVLRNLLENVAKYTPKNTAVQISIDQTSLSIRDHGPGVSPEDLPHLFDAFYRSSTAQHSRTPGYGLGLMLAKQIVGLHNGTLSARNHPEGGLDIHLELPNTTKDLP